MSYPPPPDPRDPRPQDSPGPNPGWQSQPYYQPQDGNWAAPRYGEPPRQNRAGLIIVVSIIFLLAIIVGLGVLVGYRATAGGSDNGAAPEPSAPPAASPTSKATPTLPRRSVPTAVPSMVPSKAPATAPTNAPTKAVPSKPGVKVTNAAGAVNLASTFVNRLNAGNTDAATALACDETRQIFPVLIKTWIKPPTKLVIADVAIGQNPYLVAVSGTTNGQKMGGMVIVQGSCIRVFNLSPS